MRCQDDLARCKSELLNLRLAVEEQAEQVNAASAQRSAAATAGRAPGRSNPLDGMKGLFGKGK